MTAAPAKHPQTGSVLRNIYSGLGLLLGGKAAAGLISLLYMVIAARTLGPRDYGVLILIHAYVTTVCGIVEFPVSQAIVRYGSFGVDGKDVARVSRLLRFTARVEACGGALAIFATMAMAPIVGPRLGWPPAAQAFAIPYSFAVLGSLRSAPAGYLQLLRRFDLLGAHSAIQPTVRLIGAGISAIGGFGLIGFLIAWLVAAIAEWAAMWIMGAVLARRELGKDFHKGDVASVRAENPAIWRFMIGSNADVTFGELAGRIAPLAVGWLLGPAAAGLYGVAQRATAIIAQPAQLLGTSAYAELARLVAAGARGSSLRHALLRVIGVALAAALPVMAIVILFSGPLIGILAGPAFVSATGLMIWLVGARVIYLIAPPCSAALLALGRPGLSVGANLIASLGLLPLLPSFIHVMGLTGSGLQAVVQAVAVAVILAFFVWRTSLRHIPSPRPLS
jgi:O-antigen/teichoic acid export membrane protein